MGYCENADGKENTPVMRCCEIKDMDSLCKM